MPYIADLLSEYDSGREFIWYETDGTSYDRSICTWKKVIENSFLNYSSKSEKKDFFITKNERDTIELNTNVFLFYPIGNHREQMPNELNKKLLENNFELYTDSYGVLIFKHTAL